MFSSNSLIVSGLIFMSFIHFEFVFVYGVRKCSNFILLHAAVQFSQHHLLKSLSLPHSSFARNRVPIGAWVYFWAFYLVPLVCVSVFMPVPCCLDDCSFVVYSKSGRLISPAPFFFLKIALALQGLLYFHMNCEIFVGVLRKISLVISQGSH